MPKKIYIGTENNGTRVYWCPYEKVKEYHTPYGKIIYEEIDSW